MRSMFATFSLMSSSKLAAGTLVEGVYVEIEEGAEVESEVQFDVEVGVEGHTTRGDLI